MGILLLIRIRSKDKITIFLIILLSVDYITIFYLPILNYRIIRLFISLSIYRWIASARQNDNEIINEETVMIDSGINSSSINGKKKKKNEENFVENSNENITENDLGNKMEECVKE